MARRVPVTLVLIAAMLLMPKASLACLDADGDGYGEDCPQGPDCDDIDDRVHPGALEVCDARDNDCDGQTDNLETPTVSCGWGVCTTSIEICRDGLYQECIPILTSPDYQDTEVTCDDGLDNDCDGFSDLDDTKCRGGAGGSGGCSCGLIRSGPGPGLVLLALLAVLRRRRPGIRKTRSPSA